MQRLKDNMIPYLKQNEIQTLVKGLAKQISHDYQGKDLVLICPLKGSIIFLSDLSRQLQIPHEIEFMHIKSVAKGGTIRILKDIGVEIRGKHVLIVEEIIDAGRTLIFLKDRLKLARPESVKVVSLLDKPARRELPIQPDYVGRTIEDRFVVGYGLDSEELGRNYKEIYYPLN